MKMPVWPVARKVQAMPRACISRSMASAVNILPTEQSVPTVSRRLPGRLTPVAMGKARSEKRASTRRVPFARARSAKPGMVPRARVQTAGEIVAEIDGLQEGIAPEVGDGAAAIGDADDEGAGTSGAGFGEGLVGQSEVGVAVGKAELANALLGPPVGDANGRFGG